MRLTELDPRWLTKDGRRIGVIFISPLHATADPKMAMRQTCFFEATPWKEQCTAVWAACDDLMVPDPLIDWHGRHFGYWQGCKEIAWQCAGGVESASFDNLTITPSIDGSQGGLWHGFVTAGEVR